MIVASVLRMRAGVGTGWIGEPTSGDLYKATLILRVRHRRVNPRPPYTPRDDRLDACRAAGRLLDRCHARRGRADDHGRRAAGDHQRHRRLDGAPPGELDRQRLPAGLHRGHAAGRPGRGPLRPAPSAHRRPAHLRRRVASSPAWPRRASTGSSRRASCRASGAAPSCRWRRPARATCTRATRARGHSGWSGRRRSWAWRWGRSSVPSS